MIAQSLLTPFTIAPPAGADRNSLATTVLAACKASILPHLATAKIALLRIHYDGGGDEGQICEIDPFDAEGEPINLPHIGCERHQLQYNGNIVVDVVDLSVALENMAESALEALHGGWENSEGAFGEVVIDVPTSTVTLEHNNRFVSYDTTHHDL